MLLLALLFAVGAGVAAKQTNSDAEKATLPNFLEYTKRCEKELIYLTVPMSSLPPNTFRPYGNTTAKSEADCARRCIERTVFCAAARYFHLENICQFSAKYIDCNLGQLPRFSSEQNIIHCVQCGALSLPRPPRPPPTLAPVRPTTVTSRSVAAASQTSTQPLIPLVPDSQRVTERHPTLISLLSPDTLDTQAPPTQLWRSHQVQLQPLEDPTIPPVSPLTLSSIHPTLFALSQFVDTNPNTSPDPSTTPSKKQPVEEFVDLAVEGIKTEEQQVTPSIAECSQEMMKPCIFGFGRDCKLIKDEITGCPVCACPYRSPARGCAGPQGLKVLDRFDMLMGRDPCPSDHSMQIVDRWYRKVDKSAGIDECYPEKEPYCGWQQDVNIWRMPRTKEECNYFCYSDDELRSKNIPFRL